MKAQTVTLFLLFTLIFTACNTTGTQPVEQVDLDPVETVVPSPAAVAQGEPVEMNCATLGLPCSPDEVDPQQMERASQIHQDLMTRMGEEESLDSLRASLESMDEVRMVLSNPYSLVFILDGSLPMGIYDAVKASGLEDVEATARPAKKVLASLRPPFTALKDVVGDDTSRENDKRHKRALILSPFEFEYMVPDSGAMAAQILGGIPDYKGRVDYITNEEVVIDWFRNWNQYDLILYNGHGGAVTGTDTKTGAIVTTTFITTGDEQFSCYLVSDAQLASYPPGVGCTGVSVRTENIVGRPQDGFKNYLTIYPNFFSAVYPSGLDKAVIIFNGCVTFVSDFLPTRLSGKNSVFFGWDQNVLANFNPGVMSSLLSEMAKGHVTEKAYDKACETGCVDTAGKGARLMRYQAKDDLRIREIAMPLHPLTGKPLTDGDKIPVYGYPNDGQVDELPFFIEVTGVDFNEIRNYTIRFEVNEQEVSGSWNLYDPEAVEKWESPGLDTYRILDRMVLPFDYRQDQAINFTILVDLPEGGKSQSVQVKPLTRNPVLGLESFFSMEDSDMVLDSYASAEVPLSLVEIKDEAVSFESLKQPDLLKYDALDVIVPYCEAKSKLFNGSIEVSKAVFPKDGFTNLRIPMPDTFTFNPTPEIREDIVISCPGASTPLSIPSIFWWASFSIANEDRYTDEGIEIKAWSRGEGSSYAVFHDEINRDELVGEFTLQIREP